MSKKIELVECSRCGVELSLKEINRSTLINCEGHYYGTGRRLCAICSGEMLHKMGLKE